MFVKKHILIKQNPDSSLY